MQTGSYENMPALSGFHSNPGMKTEGDPSSHPLSPSSLQSMHLGFAPLPQTHQSHQPHHQLYQLHTAAAAIAPVPAQGRFKPRLVRSATLPSGSMYFDSAFSQSPSAIASWSTAVNMTAPNSPYENLFDFSPSDFPCERPGSSSDSSTISVPQYATTGASTPSMTESPKIARPPNAWILYRSAKLTEYKQQNPKMYERMSRNKSDRGLRPTQANMSKTIAEWWAAEPQDVKDHYHQLASLKSVIHQAENPGYRFNPNKTRKVSATKKERKSKKAMPPSQYQFPLAVQPHPQPAARMPNTPPAQAYRSTDFAYQLTPPMHGIIGAPQVANPQPIDLLPSRSASLAAQLEQLFPPQHHQHGSYSPSFQMSLSPPAAATEWPYSFAAPDSSVRAEYASSFSAPTAFPTLSGPAESPLMGPSSASTAFTTFSFEEPTSAAATSHCLAPSAFSEYFAVPSSSHDDNSQSEDLIAACSSLECDNLPLLDEESVQDHKPSASTSEPAAEPQWWPFRSKLVEIDSGLKITVQQLMESMQNQ